MTETQPDPKKRTDDELRAHLSDLKDGCGCTEIWEHTSESRDEDD